MKWCSTSRSANCLRKSSSGTEAFVSAPPSASHTHTHTHTKTAEEMCHKSKGFLLQARLSGPLQIKGREAVAGSFPRGHMVQPQFSLLFHYTVDSTGKKKKKKLCLWSFSSWLWTSSDFKTRLFSSSEPENWSGSTEPSLLLDYMHLSTQHKTLYFYCTLHFTVKKNDKLSLWSIANIQILLSFYALKNFATATL